MAGIISTLDCHQHADWLNSDIKDAWKTSFRRCNVPDPLVRTESWLNQSTDCCSVVERQDVESDSVASDSVASFTSNSQSEVAGGEDDVPSTHDILSTDDIMGRIDTAVKFLTGSDEYQWFLAQARSSATLQHVGPGTDEVVRKQLFEHLHGYASRKTIVQRDAVTVEGSYPRVLMQVFYRLEWDPIAILTEQFGSVDTAIGSFIVINGASPDAQATTVQEYLQTKWPRLGPKVLQILQAAILQGLRLETSLLDGAVSLQISGGQSILSLTGTIATALEIGEILAYVVCACRSSDSAFPKLSVPQTNGGQAEDSVVIDIRCELSTLHSEAPAADCWHRLFRNPVVAHGYPIPLRGEKDAGLEIRAHMMAVLGRACWATTFDSIFLLKGVTSAFIPVDTREHAITWHYIVKNTHEGSTSYCANDCTDTINRLSYGEAVAHVADYAPFGIIGLSVLENKRHFVGLWTECARVVAGTSDGSYNVQPSASDADVPSGLSLTSVAVGGGKYGTMGLTFAVGNKDTSVQFASHAADERIISAAGGMAAVFYDTLNRKAWLLNCQDAIAYMVRAWLSSPGARQDALDGASTRAIRKLDDAFAKFGTRTRKVLLDKALRHVKLFGSPEDSLENYYVGPPSNAESSWTVGNLIDFVWERLQAIHDHTSKNRKGAIKQLRRPTLTETFEGYDLEEIYSASSSIEPRSASLRHSAGRWASVIRQVPTVPILTANIGDLITPLYQLGTCARNRHVPDGRDYLAATVFALDVLANRFRANQKRCCRKLGPQAYWSESPSKPCTCKGSRSCKVSINQIHYRCVHTTIKNPDHDLIFTNPSEGAVVFGQKSHFDFFRNSLAARSLTTSAGLHHGSDMEDSSATSSTRSSIRRLWSFITSKDRIVQ